jgi:ABC-2 type transport system permease protein
MAIIVGLLAAHRAAASGDLEIDGININGIDLEMLTNRLGPAEMENFARGIDLTLLLSSSWPFIVLTFVVFFYCLGALYDERKDRSVLFWKSLPISDTQTVLSKVASAVLVAPLLAVLASVITMYCFMAIISVVVMLHGGNAWTLIWGPASPLWVIGGHVAWIPVYALWALPTVGWLLLCSAWARSKPFLWAIMVPLFAGIFVSWFDIMELFDLDGSWFWAHVVARMLLGTVPLADFFYRGDMGTIEGNENLQSVLSDLSPANHLASLTMPELWIGVIAGAVMIFAAIRLRRWRDEG